MAKQYKTLHPVKYYRDYINQNVRPDGRELSKFRPVIVNVGSINTADGSALAKIGKTTVVCGIKAEFCMPKAERPNEGFLIPNVELPPLCSSKFKSGPPGETAQISTRLIADILDYSKCINLEDLCIAREKLAWCLYADMICLDYDGCLIDACLLALMAALNTLKLPRVDYDSALDNKLVEENDKKLLKVYNLPTSTTYAIFDDRLITDPTEEEESLAGGTLTIVVKEKHLCMVHKPGGNPLSEEQMSQCIEETIQHSLLLTSLLEAASSGDSQE